MESGALPALGRPIRSERQTESAARPPSYAPPPLSLLIAPLERKVSYLQDNQVEGVVYVKGLANGSKLEGLSIRLTVKDRFPAQPDIVVARTPWSQVFTASGISSSVSSTARAKHIEAFGRPPADIPNQPSSSNGHKFKIPLDTQSKPLPGCLHLDATHAGEVSYELTVKAIVTSLSSGIEADGNGASDRKEMRETHAIHITPYANHHEVISDEDGAGPSRAGPSTSNEVNASRPIRRGQAEAVIRLVLSRDRVRMDERLPVGVEIRQGESDGGSSSGQGGAGAIKGLRRVKVELWRRIRTPSVALDGAGLARSHGTGQIDEPGSSSMLKDSLSGDASSLDTLTQDHLALLHKSGKSCRFSSTNPVRLLFELPALSHISSTQSIPGYGTCGDITQSTAYHDVAFFVRAIAGFDGEESGDVVLDREVVIECPEWTVADASEADYDLAGNAEEGLEMPSEMLDGNQGGSSTQPLDEATRHLIYRLKGIDLVGESGTTRVSENAGPSGTSGHIAEGSADPPPFSEATAEAPVHATQDEHEGGFGGPPTFDESQHHSREPITDAQPAPYVQSPSSGQKGFARATDSIAPSRQRSMSSPPPTHLSGELATWIEYDGYETFSQPPPTAAVSLGSSTSMDMPQDGDELAVVGEFGGAALARDGPASRPIGMEDRVRLMEELGLGEGTRVFDMHGDLPPGIDEPSLPALPNAIMPHHRRRRQGSHPSVPLLESDHMTAPPPAFTSSVVNVAPTLQVGPPPPTFAASEAAEARGMVAAGPQVPTGAESYGDPNSSGLAIPSAPAPREGPLITVSNGSSGARTPDLPPIYEGHAEQAPAPTSGSEAPPGYV